MTTALMENEPAYSGDEMHTDAKNRAGMSKESDDETYTGPSIVIECVKRKKKKKRRSSTDTASEYDDDDVSEASSRGSKTSRASSRASSKHSKSSRRSKTASPKRKSSRKLSSSSSSSKRSESSKSKRALKRRASLDALTNRHAVLPTETLASGLSDRHLNFESRLESAKFRRQMVQNSIENLIVDEDDEDDAEQPSTTNRTPTVMPLDLEEPTNTAFCQSGPPEAPRQRPALVESTGTAQQRRGLDDWKRHLSFRHILDNYTYDPASFDDHEDEVSLGELPEGCEESQSTIDLEASRAIETFDNECASDVSDKQQNINKFLEAMEPQKRNVFRLSMVGIWVAAATAIVVVLVFLFAK